MSEFLAEARILVRPDTTKFRAELEAALTAATAKPITIPVVPVVAGGISAATAQTSAFTSAQAGAAAETQAVAASLEKQTVATVQADAALKKLTVDQTAHNASLGKLERGAGSSALSLLGIRGATLAASGGFLAGAAAVTVFAQSLKSAAALQTELNVFAVNAGATADQMERVSAAAKALGRDISLPGVTAQTAATAMTELAKAGLSVEDAMAGARGALQLATAAQIDTGQSANLVANTLNAFGLAGTDAVKVADLLAGAAKSAQGEIGEFGTALGQVASVDDQFGVSAGDTVTLLTQLAKAGLQGGRAGTTLRVAILGLIKPTAAAAVELDKLKKAGVEITDPRTGAFNPTAFAQINEALKAYSKEQQNVIRNTIFSSDAIKVLGRATQGGVQDFNKINQAVNESGLSLDASAARTKGLTGDFENLSNQVGALQLTVGKLASGPVSALVKSLANTAQAANTAADGLITLAGAVKTLTGNLADSIPVLGRYAGLVAAIAKIQIDPVGGIGDALKGITDRAKAAAEGLQQAVTDNVAGLRDVPGLKDFIDQLNVFVGAIEKSGPSTKKGMDKVVGAVKDGAAEIGNTAKQFEPFNVKRIQNIIGGFDAEEIRAKISGDNAKLISVLQEEQTFLQAQLQKQGVKNRPALKRAIEQALLGTVNEIDSIQSQAKSETQRIANDAKQNASKLEQAVLSGQSLARDQRQNAISAAAQTKPLTDDIAQQKKLRDLVLTQIEEVKKRISLEGGRKAAIVALKTILTQIDGQLKSLAEQQKQAVLEQRKNLVQNASLDVDLAQITGNRDAEVAARLRLISQLKKEQALVKNGTNEWKQLRNDIATQNAAIAAVTAEKKKQGQSFAQASFEFLQTQQGFASNLLGNLIPSGATAGLVGRGAVAGALNPTANAADGQAKSGPTAGQAQTTNGLLLGILGQLKFLNGETAAPEASRQNWGQRSVMDGVGGG